MKCTDRTNSRQTHTFSVTDPEITTNQTSSSGSSRRNATCPALSVTNSIVEHYAMHKKSHTDTLTQQACRRATRPASSVSDSIVRHCAEVCFAAHHDAMQVQGYAERERDVLFADAMQVQWYAEREASCVHMYTYTHTHTPTQKN